MSMEEVKLSGALAQQKRELLTRHWNLPAKNKNFTGRENLLDQISDKLSQSKPLVISALHGLGGVGKTQLVTEYAYRNEKNYERILWIPAESTDQIEAAYLALGQDLKLIPEKTPPAEAIQIVKHWLTHHPKNLIIFDNAPDYKAVQDYILPSGADILITSRHTEWPEKGIEVGVFSLEECFLYFKRIVGEREFDSPQKIEELAIELGRLPLALAQAVAYIRENKISIQAYIDLYQEKKAYLLSKESLPEGDHHAAVYVTWDVTMDVIKQASVLAPKLLNLCAYLYNSGIPQEVLGRYSTNRENNPEEEFIEDAIGLLRSYSMITTSAPDDAVPSVWLHNLVQEVSVARNEKNVQTAWLETVALLYQNDEVSVDRSGLEESFKFSLNVMLHAKRVVGLAKKLNFSSVLLMRFFISSTLTNHDLSLMEDELVLSNMLPGEVDRLRYRAFAYEAIGLRNFMDFEKSEACFHQALALRLEMDHAEFAWELMSSYITLAILSLVRGDYEGALDFCENAFDIIEKTSDKKSFTPWVSTFIKGVEYLLKKSPYRQRNTKLFFRWAILLPQLSLSASDLLNQMGVERKWTSSGGSVEYTRSGNLYVHSLFWVIQTLCQSSDELNIDPSPEIALQHFDLSQIEALQRQYESFSLTGLLQGTISDTSTILENLIGSESSGTTNSEAGSVSGETRGVLKALHGMVKGSEQSLQSVETDDDETAKSFINTMVAFTDVMEKLPGLYDAHEKHSGAEIPDGQKSIRELVFKNIKDTMSENVRELEGMRDDLEELEKTINLDKKVIEQFECALQFVLGASQMLKRSFDAYRQWLMQSQGHDAEDVEAKCQVQEIIEECFIAPMRALLHKFVTPKRILVFFQDNLDSRSEEFAEMLSQDEERFNMLVEFINEHEKIRHALINALYERNEQLLRQRKEGISSAESEIKAGQASINDFLYLKVIDNLIFVERNLLRSLKSVSYILAMFPVREDFELFCVRESALFVDTPDSCLVELDVVQQFLTSLKALTLSFERLRGAFECAPHGVKKSLEGLVPGVLVSVTQFRDMYLALHENDQMVSELFLFMAKTQLLRGDSSAVDVIMENFNLLSLFAEKWLFIFSIMKKRFDDIDIPAGLVIVKTDAALQSTQFYEGFVLTFKEIIKQAALVKAILIEFPSKERLPEILKGNKACIKVIEEITGVSEGAVEGAEGADVFDELDASDPRESFAIKRYFQERRRAPQQERERLTVHYDKCGKLSYYEKAALDRANSNCEIIEKSQKHANDAREKKNLESVISYYELMVVISPFDPHLSYQLAEFYDVLSRHYEAVNDAENAIIYIKKSEEMFKKSLAVSPDNRVLVAYANFLYFCGRYDEALLYVQIVLQLQSEAQQILRFDFLLMSLLPECLHEYIETDGIVEIPLGMFARYLCIVCCGLRDNLRKADQMFRESLPDVVISQNPVSFHLLADCGDLLNQNVVVKNLNALAYYKRAKKYYEEMKLDEAIMCYKKCLLFESDKEDVHHNLACLYHASSDIASAESHFQEALVNGGADTYSEYGFFLYKQKHYDAAIPYFLNTLLMEDNQSNLFYCATDAECLDESLKKEIENVRSISVSAMAIAYYGIIRCYYALNLNQECQEKLGEFRQWVEKNSQALNWRLLRYTYAYLQRPDDVEECEEMLSAIELSKFSDAEAMGRFGLTPVPYVMSSSTLNHGAMPRLNLQ